MDESHQNFGMRTELDPQIGLGHQGPMRKLLHSKSSVLQSMADNNHKNSASIAYMNHLPLESIKEGSKHNRIQSARN